MRLIPHHQDDRHRREYRSPDGTWRVVRTRRPGGNRNERPRWEVHERPVAHYAVGVAMAPTLLRDGKVKSHMLLTPTETQVAVWLAEGKSVRDMAEATGRTQSAIYWHLQQIYQKQSISRQADLVRLVLSLAEFG